MGKTHDDARRLSPRSPFRSRPESSVPAPDELLTEVFGLAEPELADEPSDRLEAVGSRALPSRFSLRRGAAPSSERPAAAGALRRREPPPLELGPLLDEPGEIRWEGAIFERVSSIEQQLREVEERLGKRIPEVEERLLHLLEVRLLRFERELDTSLAGLSEHISRVGEGRRFWHGVSLAGTAVLVLLSLFVVFQLL